MSDPISEDDLRRMVDSDWTRFQERKLHDDAGRLVFRTMVAEAVLRGLIPSDITKAEERMLAEEFFALIQSGHVPPKVDSIFYVLDLAWGQVEERRALLPGPDEPKEDRGPSAGTLEAAREAHRLLKRGEKWRTVRKVVHHDTYMRWCEQATGEQPIVRKR